MEDKKVALAKIKNIKGSARKTRLVVNAIRSLTPQDALDHLQFMNYRNSTIVSKVIKTAINNANMMKMNMPYKFEEIKVDEGVTRRGIRFKGRANVELLNKRYCNITVKISEETNGKES
jgi:large subunit ribosomal protein L22